MWSILWIILAVFAALAALFVLAVRGRRGHPGLENLRGWNYAHRGLHDSTRPENSLAAFRAAKEKGYGIELDVHLLADGNLAVIHDSTLQRTTGREGTIEALTTEELQDYFLEGTRETIPTLQQVLELYDGQAPLIVELKSADNNCARLCEAVCRQLDAYTGAFCLESFDPRCIRWLRKHRPDLIRGQLTENFCRSKNKLPWIVKFVMTHQLLNFWTVPDFVAYRFADRKTMSNRLARGLWGVQGVTWTLKTPEQHEAALAEDWIPIFENYEP